jgi:hypothetical protein
MNSLEQNLLFGTNAELKSGVDGAQSDDLVHTMTSVCRQGMVPLASRLGQFLYDKKHDTRSEVVEAGFLASIAHDKLAVFEALLALPSLPNTRAKTVLEAAVVQNKTWHLYPLLHQQGRDDTIALAHFCIEHHHTHGLSTCMVDMPQDRTVVLTLLQACEKTAFDQGTQAILGLVRNDALAETGAHALLGNSPEIARAIAAHLSIQSGSKARQAIRLMGLFVGRQDPEKLALFVDILPDVEEWVWTAVPPKDDKDTALIQTLQVLVLRKNLGETVIEANAAPGGLKSTPRL